MEETILFISLQDSGSRTVREKYYITQFLFRNVSLYLQQSDTIASTGNLFPVFQGKGASPTLYWYYTYTRIQSSASVYIYILTPGKWM